MEIAGDDETTRDDALASSLVVSVSYVGNAEDVTPLLVATECCH